MAEPTYTKLKLSASINGKGILVAQIVSPGTLVHTSINNIVDNDEIWIYAMNNHTADLGLFIQFGGTDAKDLIQCAVPFKQGLYLVVPGLPLNNTSFVRAYAEQANLISLFGWVNRIMP